MMNGNGEWMGTGSFGDDSFKGVLFAIIWRVSLILFFMKEQVYCQVRKQE